MSSGIGIGTSLFFPLRLVVQIFFLLSAADRAASMLIKGVPSRSEVPQHVAFLAAFNAPPPPRASSTQARHGPSEQGEKKDKRGIETTISDTNAPAGPCRSPRGPPHCTPWSRKESSPRTSGSGGRRPPVGGGFEVGNCGLEKRVSVALIIITPSVVGMPSSHSPILFSPSSRLSFVLFSPTSPSPLRPDLTF